MVYGRLSDDDEVDFSSRLLVHPDSAGTSQLTSKRYVDF